VSSRALSLCLPFLLLAGCAGYPTLGRARTIPRGAVEVAIAPVAASPLDIGSPSVLPNLRGAVRWGTSERTDVGLSTAPLLAQLDVKTQLLRAEDPRQGVDVALAVAGSYGALTASGGDFLGIVHAFGLGLAPLVGLNVGEGHQVLLAPRLGVELIPPQNTSSASSALLLNAGGTFGLAFKVNDRVFIQPYASYLRRFSPGGSTPANFANHLEVGCSFTFMARQPDPEDPPADAPGL
jgi:hypothetical protein